MNAAKSWCFTWNNYPETYKNDLQTAFRNNFGISWCFQQETGNEGTHHIQGCVKFSNKLRPIEKLGLSRSIHWEASRGTWGQNIAYCSKEDTRTGNLTYYGCILPRPIWVITELYPWQLKIKDLLLGEPDQRSIYWIWEPTGNTGKSAFVKYMAVTHRNVLRATDGKKADIINLAYNADWETEVNALIIDLPRHNDGKLAYGAVEDIKNGMITNTKYETGNKFFNAPHIIIFANQPPFDLSAVSADRWVIREIINNDVDLQINQLLTTVVNAAVASATSSKLPVVGNKLA
ncbi:replication associated protein [Miresoil virus 123]|uniref:Replication associated protein n=1 Tax=Miresoil virus 123 TaxID=2911452 RepID=A0A9E8M579_9VIRU|nr:replication associated protein [Miresoil virus 123]